ncbi:hypothetical protein M2165_001002 [Variovorax sp. TBS-050B]|uniref:T6SS immunity protein Tli4 family protein n=1 Tax=Variovorax sp. TBS-050B TaxID=2940551 RepID=UPI0024745977|nr:T6SS immunity protein Tli4 family protein [Variovorax sp. TBS-050B]MDH6591113.1 hypothetical protein [Variovorax sp. TBS-050B]
MSRRIDKLFEPTKLLCFGRYVLTVPVDSRLSFGRDFPTLPNQANELAKIMAAERAKILAANDTAEISYSGKGPAPNIWLIRSYKSVSAKEVKLESFRIFHLVGPHIFVDRRGTGNGATERSILLDILETAKNLRLREPDEVPKDPGLCHEYGFTRDATYASALSQVGLHIAALPDVVFSVESNQAASTQGSNGDGLLKLINDRKREAGSRYPQLTTLREGKKKLHGWDGEESLVRYPDGHHDFEWMFIGETGNVARPALIDVTMRTKVAADRVGAAAASSLTDEEAIELWDRLLEGFKFRVAVPGAPPEAVAIK